MAGGDVTVLGGAGKTFTLHFDTNANAQLASVLASNISAGVLDHSISPSNDATPPLSGKIGEFVRAVKCSQLKHQLARALKPARAAAYLS